MQAQRLDARSKRFAMQLMAFPARFQSFFKHDAQALTHGVNQVAARGVVIGVIAVPITLKFMQVEVITLHGFFTLPDDFDGPVVECDGAQPRQRAETLMASVITGGDSPFTVV